MLTMITNQKNVSNFFHNIQASWSEAFDYCRDHGMKLASITSQEENDRAVNKIKESGK